ncbi:MAG: FAD-dependent thymidylate synthase [Chloroflexi bacterium]|nr:FAD-dependent thymidylate synthase [Chloroflexota bacterium]
MTSAPSAPPRNPEPHGSPFPARRVYSVVGVPPEIQAYALAKYSRSSQGMLESIQELSAQKAEQFLDTFYFQYGHRSIADLAHLVFGLEQISILAAVDVVDEPVWDGQERSTRYQPFRKTGWYLPHEIYGTPAEATFRQTADALFSAYEHLTDALLEHLIEAVPRPAELGDSAYRRTLRARAFDVARSLLPLATHTSVGQIVSARVLERQISRLLGSPYAELRAIGAELKGACQLPASAPLSDAPQPPAAPTLVKYAEPSEFTASRDRDLRAATELLLTGLGEPDRSARVELAEAWADPLREIVATLLYHHDAVGHSLRQIQAVVADLRQAQAEEIFDLSLAARGKFDDLPTEHRGGYALTFDVLVDLGSFRDLHRHRRCVQVRQPLTWSHAFERPEDVFANGLGLPAALAALEGGLGELYEDALLKAEQASASIRGVSDRAADYVLPLAYRTRCLFKMDWAEAAYVIEQRTQPQGHFSYRRAAWGMYTALRERHPRLAEPIRAVDPDGPLDLLRR